MKKLIGALLAVFMLVNLSVLGSGVGHAAGNEEQAVIKSLINNGYIITADGLTDEEFNLEADEGAVLLWLDSTSDLDAFKALSQAGKKELINNLAQSNWGDYLGVRHYYAAVLYDDMLYATSQVTYGAESSALTIEVYDQGTSVAPEWMYAEDAQTPPVNPAIAISDNGVVIKSNTMVPAAAVFKALGGSVVLNSKTSDVTIKYSNVVITGKLNSKYITVNGSTSFYNIPIQAVNGKLMVPVALLKNALKANVEIGYGSMSNGSKYIQGILVTVDDKKLAISINDKYEAYQKYYGKTAWIITPEMYLTDLNGDDVYRNTVKNLAQVQITNITRDPSDGDWLNVTVVHKGRTYVAIVKETNFTKAIYTASPYTKFKFSQANWNLITEEKIVAGMTEQMVLLSWGTYTSSSKSTSASGTTGTWIYESDYNTDYLYFTNGILKQVIRY